jgi:hypothetical protein
VHSFNYKPLHGLEGGNYAGRFLWTRPEGILRELVLWGEIGVWIRVSVKALNFFLGELDNLGNRNGGKGPGEVWDDTERRIGQPGDGPV